MARSGEAATQSPHAWQSSALGVVALRWPWASERKRPMKLAYRGRAQCDGVYTQCEEWIYWRSE